MTNRMSPWWGCALLVAATACNGDDGGTSIGSCPPEAPFGTQEGDVAPNVTLYDCDGAAVQLRDACRVHFPVCRVPRQERTKRFRSLRDLRLKSRALSRQTFG